MKKKISMVLVFITALFIFEGCKKESFTYKSNTEKEINYTIGVVRTTGQKNKSIIKLYDRTLEEIDEDSLPYGSMGGTFYNPIVFENSVYTIPQGIATKKDLGLVLEINTNTTETQEYKIDKLAMNSLSVDDTYIYTSNTLNGIASLNQYNKKTNTLKSIDLKDEDITKIETYKENVYCFSISKNESGSLVSRIYVLDSLLNIIDKIDISNWETEIYKSLVVGNKLYFSCPALDLDSRDGKIIELSLDTLEMKEINLSIKNPSDIVLFNDKLFINDLDLTRSEGNKISVLDIHTKEEVVIPLEHTALQIGIKDNILFAVDDNKIYSYEIDGNNLILNNSTNYAEDKDANVHYYFGGFFLKP
jgi:hypothetical protein